MSTSRTIIFDRDLTCVQKRAEYKKDHGAPNFHAKTADYNCDLIIKVSNLDGKLQGCIPCDKALIIEHVDQIKSKFNENSGTTWSKKEEHGLNVFELTTHIEPKFVCDFIKIIYEGKTELNQKNGIPFYELANFLLVEKLKEPVREYLIENVGNETLVDTWSIVEPEDLFQKPCMDFVKSDDFDSERLLKEVGKLTIGKFIEFLKKAGEMLTSKVLIGLRRNWLKENPGDENCEKVIFGADFESVSNEDKLEFYDEVVDDMDGGLSKRVFRHMFPVGSVVLNVVKNKIKINKNEQERQKMIDDLENFCSKVVGGDLDENSVLKFVYTNEVRAAINEEYTWKLRIDNLTENSDQYFGVAPENINTYDFSVKFHFTYTN